MFVIHDVKSLESDILILFSGTLTAYISLTESDYSHQLIQLWSFSFLCHVEHLV